MTQVKRKDDPSTFQIEEANRSPPVHQLNELKQILDESVHDNWVINHDLHY
jgi:hypothetical protein